MSDIDPAKYEANRGRVQAALILCEDYLEPNEVSFLQEYIDHDEFGLALDEMVALLVNRSAVLPLALVDELESMGHLMYPGENRESHFVALRQRSAGQTRSSET
jgi:hypothetical protein